MNIGSIVQLLEQDPSIADDVPGFLKRMNEKNIKHVESVTTTVTVEDVVTLTSIADRNGGDATEQNVADALDVIAKIPLVEKAQQLYEKVLADIQAGEVVSEADVVAAFAEPV